jgi:DNA-binding NarL/FixJ family response regulator
MSGQILPTRKCGKCTENRPQEQFSIAAARGISRSRKWNCDECIRRIAEFRAQRKACRVSMKAQGRRHRWTLDEINQLLAGDRDIPGVTRRVVNDMARKVKAPTIQKIWPTEFKAEIVRLAGKGVEWKAIAARYGITKGAVSGIVWRNRGRLAA